MTTCIIIAYLLAGAFFIGALFCVEPPTRSDGGPVRFCESAVSAMAWILVLMYFAAHWIAKGGRA